jgi:hypothetical protein
MWEVVSLVFVFLPPVAGVLTGLRRPRWGWAGIAVTASLYLFSYRVVSPGVAWPVSHSWNGWFLYVVAWVGVAYYAGYALGWLTRRLDLRERRRESRPSVD